MPSNQFDSSEYPLHFGDYSGALMRAYLDLRGVSERMCALLGGSERRLAQAECERAELRIDCDFLRKEATYHVRRAAVCIRCVYSFFAVQDEEVAIYKTASATRRRSSLPRPLSSMRLSLISRRRSEPRRPSWRRFAERRTPV